MSIFLICAEKQYKCRTGRHKHKTRQSSSIPDRDLMWDKNKTGISCLREAVWAHTIGWVRGKKWVKILTPSKIIFLSLIINTGLGQVHHSNFWPPRTPGGAWGALGGFGGVCRPQNCYYCLETNFSPGMQCFGLKQLVTLCFWGFGSNGALLGQNMAVLGPNRVCKKVDFSQKHHLQICPNRTKGALLSQ